MNQPGSSPADEFSRLLAEADKGDGVSTNRLLPLVYDQLRRLAAAQLAHEKPGQTLQPTALVHEAWLRLCPADGAQGACAWRNRGHFFAAAAEAMRRILVESARRRNSLKRGAGAQRHDVESLEIPMRQPPEEVLAVHDALDRLESVDQRAAALVKLRYFAGFTLKEAAQMLDISPRTADDVWSYARAFLAAEISGAGD